MTEQQGPLPPRRLDSAEARAYWRMIDQAAERVRQLAARIGGSR